MRPDTPIGDVLKLMVRQRIGCVPVTDDTGKLVGIFSERDAIMESTSTLTGWPPSLIRDVMTAEPATLA